MRILYTFGLIIFSVATLSLSAQTHNWTGNGGDTSWFNQSNWDAGTLPDENSTVSIVGSFDVFIDSNGAEAYTIDLHNGGTLTMEGNLETGSIITIHPNSSFIFTTGVLSGSGIHNNGLLKLESTQSRTFSNTQVVNNATFLITDTGITQILNTTITNNATGILEIPSVGGFLQQSTISTLNNTGIVRKIPDGVNPIGNFYLVLEINNEGIIEAQEDQIFLMLASATDFTNFPSGRVIGNGTYDITANFINQGTISPGSTPNIGSIDITNNFSLNEGIFELDIAGTDITEYDRILVTGFPSMDGTFDIKLQFEPNIEDEFTVITWNPGGNTCNFPQFSFATFQGVTYKFETFCNSNDVTLKIVDATILGISDVDAQDAYFFAQPNPAFQNISFKFSSELISSGSQIKLYNTIGQLVTKWAATSSEEVTFDRNGLPSGLYFAQLELEEGAKLTTRLVLK